MNAHQIATTILKIAAGLIGALQDTGKEEETA